jgi:adenylate cyclase
MTRGLRRYLRSQGASNEEIERAAREGWLTLLVLEYMLMPGARRHTLADVAARAGLDMETTRRIWRAAGFPDIPENEPRLTDADVEAMCAVSEFLGDGGTWQNIGVDTILRLTRVFSASLARMADVESDLTRDTVQGARSAGLTDEELADEVRKADRFAHAERLIEHLHRLQLRAATLRKLAVAEPMNDSGDVAVGFVDLVGYTGLAEELSDDELTALVARFSELAFDTVVAGGGRFVKNIGDEVMYVAEDVAAAARIAIQLAEASGGDELLPEARAGLAVGPVLARDGDYYGPVVNLASLPTERARPGTVLGSAEVNHALAGNPAFALRELRPRQVRDIGRVPVWVVRKAPDPAESSRRRRGS